MAKLRVLTAQQSTSHRPKNRIETLTFLSSPRLSLELLRSPQCELTPKTLYIAAADGE
jgi:hypothetical protein